MRMPKSIAPALLLAAIGWASSTNAAETYTIDPVHSSVVFRVSHLGVSYFYGRFNEVTGSFTVGDRVAESAAEVIVKVASIDTHDKKRDGHLLSPDFFNAKAFPVITFRGSKFEEISPGRIKVDGSLSLHGVTRPVAVVLDAVGAGKDPWRGFRRGYEGRLTLKRSDFGMKFMLPGVGDEVTVYLSIEGIKK